MADKKAEFTLPATFASNTEPLVKNEGSSTIDGRNLLREIEQQYVKPEQQVGIHRSASFQRKRDKFEHLSVMSMATQDGSHVHGSLSHDNVNDIEIRAHHSKASQNLSDSSTEPSDQELSKPLHVQRTTSDTFVHSGSDRDLTQASPAIEPENLNLSSDSQSQAKNSFSLPQMDKSALSDKDSGRSSSLLSPKPDQDPTRDTLQKTSLQLVDMHSGEESVQQNPSGASDLPVPATLYVSSLSGQLHVYDSKQAPSQEYRQTTHRTGANMSSSHRESPLPDQIGSVAATSPHQSSRGPFTEQHVFLIEKELLESQLRKLQAENATLQTENKLVKDKYNRAQARIRQLESHLASLQQESSHIQEELNQEVKTAQKLARDQGQRSCEELEERILILTRQMEALKSENSDLEKQLQAARLAQKASDRSLVVDSYKVQINVLQEELRQTKQILANAEKARSEEVVKRQESAAQVVKLTELKAALQQQLENTGKGTLAEKQVKSLECRLKITEDRLHQERADRAGKLSEVEEKLLTENAKLQISEKEVKRQLQRERDKTRNTEQRYRTARDENDKLRLQLSEKPVLLDSNKLRSSLNNTKHTEELKFVMEQMKREENLGQGQEPEIILLLWQQRDESFKQLKELELILTDINVQPDRAKESLKAWRDEHMQYEDQIQHHKDLLEDSKARRDELEATTAKQVHELVKEKHALQARLNNVQDRADAVTAENNSLHSSLRSSADHVPASRGKPNTWEAETIGLKSELDVTRGELEHQKRLVQRLEAELASARGQLQAKQIGLDSMVTGVHSNKLTGTAPDDSWDEERQKKLHKLTAEVSSEKVSQQQLRDELSSVTRQLEAARHEYDIMATSLEAEKNTVINLKNQCQKNEDKNCDLNNKVKSQQLELDSLKSQIEEARRTNEQAKRDKTTLYQDVQELCRKLAEKDESLSRVRTQADSTVTDLKRELTAYHTDYSQDKQQLETNLTQAKEEVELLNQRLREKDAQLQTYHRSTRELEEKVRSREDCETQASRVEMELLDTKRYLSNVQSENVRQAEQNRQSQENLDKLRAENITLREQIRLDKDEYAREHRELKHLLSMEKRHHETEKSQLQDELNKTIAELKSCKVSLTSVSETRESLESTKFSLDNTVDSLKTQLHEETMRRRLVEQQTQTLQAQLDELRSAKVGYDEHLADVQAQVTRVETELQMEKEHSKQLKQELNDAQSAAETHESDARSQCIQVTKLQAELASVKSELDVTKQEMSSKNQRLSLEVSHLSGNMEKQKMSLVEQNHQLSADLEKARQELNDHNREILAQKELTLNLEEQLRDSRDNLKRERDATNTERAIREKLDSRNMELELLVTRLRTRDGDDKFDITRQEVSRKMAELSQRVAEQLERQRGQQVDISEVRHLEEQKRKKYRLRL